MKPRPRIPIPAPLLAVLLTTYVLFAAEPPAPGMIGFRGDGSGAFAGATPPAEFDAITGKNLVWKTALPNHATAFSCPFAAGNRLYVRTFDTLFCFGDKNQAFTPSKAFDGIRP